MEVDLADRGRTAEQRELAQTVRDVALDRCPAPVRRDVMDRPPYWSAELWRLLAVELGLAAVAGTGPDDAEGSFVEAAIVIEESARALLPVPVLGHLVATAALAAAGWSGTAELADASATAAFAVVTTAEGSGRWTVRRVLHGGAADLFVVAAADRLLVLRRDDAEVAAAPSLDPTRPHATVSFDPDQADRAGNAAAAGLAVDLMRVGLAAEAVGVGRACLAMTTEYLRTREQFGRPIGSFQALQHRMADLLVGLEAAASTADHASAVAAGWSEGLAVVAPLAKTVCSDAAYRMAAETIQLHGGIGFTWEHDAHLYFKRATAIAALLGSSRVQRRLVAERAGIAGPLTPQ